MNRGHTVAGDTPAVLELLTAEQIRWTPEPQPAADPLLMTDRETFEAVGWLREALHAALTYVTALASRCDRYEQRGRDLLKELRRARHEVGVLRERVRQLTDEGGV